MIPRWITGQIAKHTTKHERRWKHISVNAASANNKGISSTGSGSIDWRLLNIIVYGSHHVFWYVDQIFQMTRFAFYDDPTTRRLGLIQICDILTIKIIILMYCGPSTVYADLRNKPMQNEKKIKSNQYTTAQLVRESVSYKIHFK